MKQAIKSDSTLFEKQFSKNEMHIVLFEEHVCYFSDDAVRLYSKKFSSPIYLSLRSLVRTANSRSILREKTFRKRKKKFEEEKNEYKLHLGADLDRTKICLLCIAGLTVEGDRIILMQFGSSLCQTRKSIF